MREVRRHDVGGTGGQALVRGQVWRPGARGVGEKTESGTSRFLPWASGDHCRVFLRVYCAPDPDASSSWWWSGVVHGCPPAGRLCPQARWGPRRLFRAAAAKISPPCCLHLTLSRSRHAGPRQSRSSEAHLLGLKQELLRGLVHRQQIPSRSRSSAIWSPGLPIQLNQTR